MAVPTLNAIHSLTWIYRSNEQLLMNTIHYRMSIAWNTASIDGFYNNIQGQVGPGGTYPLTDTFTNCLCEQATLIHMRHQLIYPIRYRGKTFDVNIAGGRTGVDKAQNVSAVITKQTELSGRRYVGSVHLGGLSATDYDNGLLNTGLKVAISQFQAAMMTKILQDSGAGESTPVIFHKVPPTSNDPRYTDISGTLLQDTLRTNRTRNVGKGI